MASVTSKEIFHPHSSKCNLFGLVVLFSFSSQRIRKNESQFQQRSWTDVLVKKRKWAWFISLVYSNSANGEFRQSLLLKLRRFAGGWHEIVTESIQYDLDLYKFTGFEPRFRLLVHTKHKKPWSSSIESTVISTCSHSRT